ncbi:ABC transporter permease [Demequina litorisediminis]|uniref:ABC transporter permease n=1 Tax=Demequina litorisediminis TaxID=1849022 RepID=UPI0024E180C8|nr:ABC transporter permease [Demequina litorisediminis]
MVFTLGKVADSDPVRTYVGVNASAEAVAQAREELGLDDPVIAQYGSFVSGAVQGDFGVSLSSKRPISDEPVDPPSRDPRTRGLGARADRRHRRLACVRVLATRQVRRVHAVRVLLRRLRAVIPHRDAVGPGVLQVAGGALPAAGRSSYGPYEDGTGFYVLDGILHGSPTYTWDAIEHLILPAFAAAVGSGVALARVLADGITSSLKSPWARTARALGEREGTILRRHALRNASSPALSLLAVQAGFMVSSLVVIEQVFSWNGLGSYLSSAIGVGDFPAIAAVCLILGTVYVLLNALVDVVLAAVDPRVRLS